jgi:hypothetical protein
MNKKSNQTNFILIFLLLFSTFSSAQTSKKEIFNSHQKVAILPAFYIDESNTSSLNNTAQYYKIIKEFKYELARDVQYKFYMPTILHQQDYKVFFRGVDTINQLLINNNCKLILSESTDYKRIAEVLSVDAIIILELSEYNKINTGNLVSIFLNLMPAQNIIGKITDAYNMNSIFTNQDLTLTLNVKIYDCKSGTIVWSNTTHVNNSPYHTAINKMSEKILKKIPYRLRK